MNLYLTADQVGIPTGGGAVTFHESEAMRSLSEKDFKLVSREQLQLLAIAGAGEPWLWDYLAYHCFGNIVKLAHIYAGTFSGCVKKLKENKAKVSYTAAAHDIQLSKAEHEKLGILYDYPHLTDAKLWEQYLYGYKNADILICPSLNSREVMRAFGCNNRIEVIPHGVDIPECVTPLPKQFTVGYLGAYGPDKGVRYLLEAWKKLDYKDATLVLAGRDSASSFVLSLIQYFGGGNIHLKGWVDNVADFYSSISCYVQPSVTEGFGIEVLEAHAHGRLALCSEGAGAADSVYTNHTFMPANVDDLAEHINYQKQQGEDYLRFQGERYRERAMNYTWDKIRQRYIELWKGMMG